MEICSIPTLPYDVPDFQYLLSLFPPRDRILRLLFPDDIRALYRALDWDLSVEDVEHYSRFWFDDAGVSFVSRSSLPSLTNTSKSLPCYYGQDILTELPKATLSWLDKSGLDPSQPFYSRLNVEGQASVGSISFVIEITGSCFSFMPGARPSTLFRVWIRNQYFGSAKTKILSWIISEPCGHERAIKEVLEKMRMVLQYMYGEKQNGLFAQDCTDTTDTSIDGLL